MSNIPKMPNTGIVRTGNTTRTARPPVKPKIRETQTNIGIVRTDTTRVAQLAMDKPIEKSEKKYPYTHPGPICVKLVEKA